MILGIYNIRHVQQKRLDVPVVACAAVQPELKAKRGPEPERGPELGQELGQELEPERGPATGRGPDPGPEP